MAFSFSSPAPQIQFQNPQSQQQPFFPQSSTMFPSFPQQQQQQQLQFSFQPQQQQQQQQQQPQQQQPQLLLFTVDKSSASYNTKWADLHPDSQKLLLQIEERILEYKDESQRLDQCSRLYDFSISSDSFELVTSHVIQELGGTGTSMERERISVKELLNEANNMMWNTEIAIRSYLMLRQRFLHPNASTISNTASASQSLVATANSILPNQTISNSTAPVYDFYYGIPKRPSPFIQHTVARFEKYLVECCQWIEELEQLILMDTDKMSSSSGSMVLRSLPSVIQNVHGFFVHVAAKVENLHQYIESMKAAYLADQRRRGDGGDPFLEADRRETAKLEAAARRVHPTLHLPAISAVPSTKGAGLHTSSPMQQPVVGASGASSGTSGVSMFSSLSAPTSASSSSLFTTPAASAPSLSSLFSNPSTPFGTSSTSLFGSDQTVGATNSSFASTPASGSSLLFSTPTLTPGAATGSGASFGAASKSSRPKSRATRR